jgi:glutaredoxin
MEHNREVAMKTGGWAVIGSALAVLFCVANAGLAWASTKTVYPSIVIYTAPGCKSCKAASDYLVANEIPFTKKDVSANEAFLEEMSEKYRCSAVPLIVIGNGQKVLKGFVPEAFQLAVREVMIKSRR